MEEGGRRTVKTRERDGIIEARSERCHTAGFKDREMVLETQNCGWPLEGPGAKEMDSFLEPLKGAEPCCVQKGL